MSLFNFLRIEDPASSSLFRIMNVPQGGWTEEPTQLMGQKRRAFDGGLLSSQRTPKRAGSCTVVFLLPELVEDFLTFIALAPATPYLGAKPMKIVPPTGDSSYQGALRSGAAITVDLEIGRMTPEEDARAATGTPGAITTVTAWTVELNWQEV